MKPRRRTPLEARFWSRVRKLESGCWEWTGCRYGAGYGVIGRGGFRGGQTPAHRVSWMIHRGDIPDGLLVCHTCDNPPCVNPDHLFLGTHTDNAHDAKRKGRLSNGERHAKLVSAGYSDKNRSFHREWMAARNRLAPRRGTDNGRSKLSEDDIRSIRRQYAEGARQVDLAAQFRVAQTLISRIVLRKQWAHVA